VPDEQEIGRRVRDSIGGLLSPCSGEDELCRRRSAREAAASPISPAASIAPLAAATAASSAPAVRTPQGSAEAARGSLTRAPYADLDRAEAGQAAPLLRG
jgi:hypothetical protein